MRFLQGVAVGGEWGGAILMAVEHAPEGKKGFFGSLPQTGVAPGLILSSLAMGAVAALPEEDMLSWGWRIPFLASVVLLLVGWFIRAKVAESPDFERMREQGDKVEVPALVVLRRYPREVLIVVGGRLAEVTWFYTVVTFSLAYATGTLGIPRATMLDATVWGATLALFTMPLCGVLGDRIGFKWIFMAGAAGILLFAPMFSRCCRRAIPLPSRRRSPWPWAWSTPRCTARKAACSRPSSRPRCATAASRWRCRCRAPSAADWRRWSPRRCWPTAAATPLHCLVPERAGPGRHRQRVLHAPAHALRAAGRRPPGGPPMKPSHLDYYFWLNSDWAYLGADRLEALARRQNVAIRYKPVDLPDVYARTGGVLLGQRSRERQDYRVAELRRWCRKLGIPVNPHPAHMCPNADQASRLVIAADLQGLPVAALYKAILHAEWCEDRDISSDPTLREIVAAQGLDADALLRAAAAPDIERRYRQYTDEAVAAGAFGSPSYVYAGELFWGQDRLEMLEEAIAAA